MAEMPPVSMASPLRLTTLMLCLPRLPIGRAQECLPHLVVTQAEFDICTPVRLAAFLAQTGWESAQFRHFAEVWGPTEQQQKYEPPGHLAIRLGNHQKGDGYKFRGRSPLMLTGRDNYRRCGAELELDLESKPELLELPQYGFRAAGWFWRRSGLNAYADTGRFLLLTRRVNGGLTHLQQRMAMYERCLRILQPPTTK